MRAASKLLQRGFANGGGSSNFGRRCAALKNKFRGKGLYSFAREEAQHFLEAEVPKGNVGGWMEDGTNAIALSQVLRFFEIQPDPGVSSLMLNRLIRFAEDSLAPPMTRLESVLALMSTRPDENYERAFATVESVLSGMSPPPYGGSPCSREMQGMWSILDLSAKVLQRCGKRVPPTLNERLCQLIMRQIECTPVDELYYLQNSLLRIYAWTVRAELPESTGLLYVLVEKTGNFKSFDFATLMRSCSRHHQATPLPVSLVMKLAQAGLMYACDCNGGDAAAVLGGVARVLSSLEPGVNDVTVRDVRSLTDHFIALLEDYQARTLHFLDDKDPLYWKGVEDVTNIAFAYELGGRMRYSHLFVRFQEYIRREVGQLEPTQLAMATGILRRSNLLCPEIAKLLADRIEIVLGELRLPELSHICATFALLPSPPQWIPEAMEVAMRLMESSDGGTTTCSAGTRFNLSIAFPQETFALPIDYNQLSSRQLVDALPLAVGKPVFEGPVVNALVAKLEDRTWNGRFSTDDVLLLLSAPNPAVVTAVHQYMEHCLREAEWSTDVLFMLPIAMQHENLYPLATDVQKALASAKAAAISPELFVSFLELLVGIWKDSDAGINEFAVVGAMDLVQAPRLLGSTLVRFLNCVQPFPSLKLSVEWLQQLSCGKTAHYIFKTFCAEELVTFLASMHAFFSNAQTSPALEPVLGSILDSSFQALINAPGRGAVGSPATVSEPMARATVLLVHLQQGMTVPLLTSVDPVIDRVTASASTYPPDLQEALRCMPLPQGSRNLFRAGSIHQNNKNNHTNTYSSSSSHSGAPSGFSDGPRRGRFTARSGGGGSGEEERSSLHGMPQRETKQDPLPESERRDTADPLDCSDGDIFMTDSLGSSSMGGGGLGSASSTPTNSSSSSSSSVATGFNAGIDGQSAQEREEGGSSSSSLGTSGKESDGVPAPTSGQESLSSTTPNAANTQGRESSERVGGGAGHGHPESSYQRGNTPSFTGASEETNASSNTASTATAATSHTDTNLSSTSSNNNNGSTTGNQGMAGEDSQNGTSTSDSFSTPGSEEKNTQGGEGSETDDERQTQMNLYRDEEGRGVQGTGGNGDGSASPHSSQSYYSKFFNSSIGVLFRGHEDMREKERASQGSSGSSSSSSQNIGNRSDSFSSVPQPRRTILRKNTSSTTPPSSATSSTTTPTTHPNSASPSSSSPSPYQPMEGKESSMGGNRSNTNNNHEQMRNSSYPSTSSHAGNSNGFVSSSFPSTFSGWGDPPKPSTPASVTSTWGTVPPTSAISTRSIPVTPPPFSPHGSSSSTMYGGQSSSTGPQNGGFFGNLFQNQGNAPHLSPPGDASCTGNPHHSTATLNTGNANVRGGMNAMGTAAGSGGGMPYQQNPWGTTTTVYPGSAGNGMPPSQGGHSIPPSPPGNALGRGNSGFGYGIPSSTSSVHAHPSAAATGAGGGAGSRPGGASMFSSSPYASLRANGGRGSASMRSDANKGESGVASNAFVSASSPSYSGNRASSIPTSPSSSSLSSSSSWMNTNHPYNINNPQHFNSGSGGGSSSSSGGGGGSSSGFPQPHLTSQPTPYNPMERPLQAAIRATVTRVPTLPGGGGSGNSVQHGSSSPSSSSLRHPHVPLQSPMSQDSSQASSPMGRAGSSSSSSSRSSSFLAPGGNIFIDPTTGNPTNPSGRASLSPRLAGPSVMVPGGQNPHSRGTSPTGMNMMHANNGRNPSSDAHHLSPNHPPHQNHHHNSSSINQTNGGGVRVNPHYLRQPTFAPVSADHPKAQGYGAGGVEPSTNGGYDGSRRSLHPRGDTSRAQERETSFQFHTTGNDPEGNASNDGDEDGSSESSQIMDKRAHQRDMLLREPADRPLAWRSAAQQVSRVSRYTTGKAKTKAHQLLTEWLASPNARLNKKQEQELQQAIASSPSSKKNEETGEEKQVQQQRHSSVNSSGSNASGNYGLGGGGGRRGLRQQQHGGGATGGGSTRRGGGSSSRGGAKHQATHQTKHGTSGRSTGGGGGSRRGCGGGASGSSSGAGSGKSRGGHSGGNSAGTAASRRGHHGNGGSGGKTSPAGRRGAGAGSPAPSSPPASGGRQSRKTSGGGAGGKHHAASKKKGKATGAKRK